MSLRPSSIPPVPLETQRVARVAFSKGNLYLTLREELPALFTDELFAALSPDHGKPAQAPWHLALTTLLVSGDLFALREGPVGDIDKQQGVQRVGRSVCRRCGDGLSRFGQAASLLHGGQHSWRQLPAQRKASGGNANRCYGYVRAARYSGRLCRGLYQCLLRQESDPNSPAVSNRRENY